MAFSTDVANRVRHYLDGFPGLHIEEKKMFGGLAFMVNGKMCINVSDDKLMCRFDPESYEEISLKPGYEQMIMRGSEYKGYCYVRSEGFESEQDFRFWLELCLDYNDRAKSSKK